MANLFDVRAGDLNAFIAKLHEAGMTPELVAAAIRKDAVLAPAMVNAALEAAGMARTKSNLFTLPQEQVRMLRQWSEDMNLGFTPEEFDAALEAIPSEPKSGAFVARVLVPYLGSPRATFDAVAAMIRFRDDSRGCYARFTDYADHRLSEQIGGDKTFRFEPQYPKGLVWETIDLGANRGRVLKTVRVTNKILPAAGILMAMAHHPAWLRRFMDHKVPHPILGGYCVTPKSGKPMYLTAVPHYNYGVDIAWSVPELPSDKYCIPEFVDR